MNLGSEESCKSPDDLGYVSRCCRSLLTYVLSYLIAYSLYEQVSLLRTTRGQLCRS